MLQVGSVEGPTVIAFRPIPGRGERPTGRDGAERGTLLLFTGVRYERLVDGMSLPSPVEVCGDEADPD